MKFVNPSVEIWEQDVTTPDTLVEAMWAHIARCVRVCYQVDKPKNNETEEEYVRRVIFRNPDERLANHYSVLEHGAVYFSIEIPDEVSTSITGNEIEDNKLLTIANVLWNNKFSKVKKENTQFTHIWHISTNLRVLVENDILWALKYAVSFNPKWHESRITVSFITNIGVTREANRHRANSPSEESTRYCNYSKKRFGRHITYCRPSWISEGEIVDIRRDFNINCALGVYIDALHHAEQAYNSLIAYGWTPQQAREVLPLATKSQLVHTAFISDWYRFLKLRADGISGPPHPNMEIIAKPLKEEFINRKYI